MRANVAPRPMTLAWIAAQSAVNVVLPKAAMQLLLDYMQVMAAVENRDIFGRYRLAERKWDFPGLVSAFGDPFADAFYSTQAFKADLRFDGLHQCVDVQLAATAKESLFVEIRAKELRSMRLDAQFYLHRVGLSSILAVSV